MLVRPSRPPNLSCRAGSRPDDGVQTGGVNGLCPDGNFAANDILLELLRYAVCRLMRVHELPVLGWIAPIEEGVIVLEGGSIFKVEPLSTTAVKILSAHKS